MIINEVVSQTDTDNLSSQGYTVVDQIEIEGYNIVLSKMPDFIADVIGTGYQLGFAKEGNSFTDYSQHDEKYAEKGEQFPLRKLITGFGKIKEWVSEYGSLAISSSVDKKTTTYYKLFKRAGFTVDKKTIMGQTLLIIE